MGLAAWLRASLNYMQSVILERVYKAATRVAVETWAAPCEWLQHMHQGENGRLCFNLTPLQFRVYTV